MLKNKIIQWIDRYPAKSLMICGLLFVITLPGLLKIKMDFGVRAWLKQEDTHLQNFDFFHDTFGNDDSIMLGLSSNQSIFQQDTIKDIQAITDKLWEIKDVIRVDSLANYTHIHSADGEMLIEDFIPPDTELTTEDLEQLKTKALKHEHIPGRLISYDAKSALFFMRMKPYFKKQPDFKPIINQVQKIKDEFSSKGYEFYTVGTAQVTDTFKSIAMRDLFILIPLLNVFIFILLLYLFRNKSGIILPFSIISLTISSAMGISGYLGIQLNNLSGMVPTILIAICIADAIHFLQSHRYFAEKEQQELKVLQKNFTPTLLTTITTMLGFFSLYSNDLVPIQDFGLLCGLGCLFAWIYSTFGIIPALKLFFKQDNKKIIHRKNVIDFSKVIPWITTHPKKIIISTFAFSILGLYLGLRNEVNSNPFNYFSQETDLYQSNQFFLKKYKGFNGLEIILNSGEAGGIFKPDFLQKVSQFQEWVETKPYVNKTYSFVNELKQLNRAMHDGDQKFFKVPNTKKEAAQLHLLYSLNLPPGLDLGTFIDVKEQYLRTTVTWNIQNSKQSLQEANKIESKAIELGLNAFATGQEHLFQGMNSYVVQGYFKSIGISVICISLLMIFVTRSIKLGLISILPNLIPIIFGAMTMSVLGRPIDVGTVLVASVCFGIAIDDTIHFLSSFTMMKNQGMSNLQAIEYTMNHVGTAIIFTTLILFIGFGVFAFAQFVPNFNFGVLSAIVLLIALLVDLIFLPALILAKKETPAE